MCGAPQPDDAHARAPGRFDPRRGILDDYTLVRAYSDLRGGCQEDLGVRFALGHIFGRDNGSKTVRNAKRLQNGIHVGARGGGSQRLTPTLDL
jgi:hypothetical protein